MRTLIILLFGLSILLIPHSAAKASSDLDDSKLAQTRVADGGASIAKTSVALNYLEPLDVERLLLSGSPTAARLVDHDPFSVTLQSRSFEALDGVLAQQVLAISTPGGGQSAGEPIPAGITSIKADAQRRALLLQGEAGAVLDLQRHIRLADIPGKRLQVSVRVLSLDAEDLRLLGAVAPGGKAGQSAAVFSSIVTKDKLPALLADSRPAILTSTWECENRATMHLLVPPLKAGGPQTSVALLAMINPYGGIQTFRAESTFASAGGQEAVSLFSSRASASGTWVVTTSPDGPAWLTRIVILPDR